MESLRSISPAFTVISAAVLDMRESFFGNSQRGHGKFCRPSCCRSSQGKVSLSGMLLRMAGIPFALEVFCCVTWTAGAAGVLAGHCFCFSLCTNPDSLSDRQINLSSCDVHLCWLNAATRWQKKLFLTTTTTSAPMKHVYVQ